MSQQDDNLKVDRLDELIDAYLGDEATEREINELEVELRRDRAARNRFAERCRLETALYRVHKKQDSPSEEKPATTHRAWWHAGALRWVAAAALVVLAAGIAMWWTLTPAGAGKIVLESGTAMVDGAPVREIRPNVPLDIPEAAVLKLTDGSLAAMERNSRLTIVSRTGDARQLLRVDRGAGTFAVTRGGGKFRIDTPAGAVTVLGTKFHLRLDGPREEVLHLDVTEGRVRVDHAGRSYELAAGERRVFGREIAGTRVATTRATTSGEAARPAAKKFAGEVTRIDGMTMVLTARGDQREQTLTLHLNHETMIWLPGEATPATTRGDRRPPLQAGTLADIHVGDRVVAEYRDESNVTSIRLERPMPRRDKEGEPPRP